GTRSPGTIAGMKAIGAVRPTSEHSGLLLAMKAAATTVATGTVHADVSTTTTSGIAIAKSATRPASRNTKTTAAVTTTAMTKITTGTTTEVESPRQPQSVKRSRRFLLRFRLAQILSRRQENIVPGSNFPSFSATTAFSLLLLSRRVSYVAPKQS